MQLLNRARRQRGERKREQAVAQLIRVYQESGRIPWSEGYDAYKWQCIQEVLGDEATLDHFRASAPLPAKHGYGLDERIIEYPWVLSRIPGSTQLFLDAGSTLNNPSLLAYPGLHNRPIIIYDLSQTFLSNTANLSYVQGDLRDMLLKDAVVESIVCISTLEHVGLDNTKLYTSDDRFAEAIIDDYRRALREFRRVLSSGGRLLLTVPYGRYENFGWQQQFDKGMVDDVVAASGGILSDSAYYRYGEEGWQISDAASCSDSRHSSVHDQTEKRQPGGAAAAGAVACLQIDMP